MALPVNATPTYTMQIPSTKETVKYRPFLVKEEKALLIAQQSEDPVVMVDTLKGIIKSCVLSKIDVDKLATFDLEYVFTQIRAKSVGEQIELIFACDTCEDEKARVKIGFDITKIKVDFPEGHTNKIELFGNVGIMMKYPSLEILKEIEQNQNTTDVESVFKIVVECIDVIYDDDQIYHAKEQTKEELLAFLENLTAEQFAKIQKFFETMPRLKQEVRYKCPVCSKEHQKVLEGLDSFF